METSKIWTRYECHASHGAQERRMTQINTCRGKIVLSIKVDTSKRWLYMSSIHNFCTALRAVYNIVTLIIPRRHPSRICHFVTNVDVLCTIVRWHFHFLRWSWIMTEYHLHTSFNWLFASIYIVDGPHQSTIADLSCAYTCRKSSFWTMFWAPVRRMRHLHTGTALLQEWIRKWQERTRFDRIQVLLVKVTGIFTGLHYLYPFFFASIFTVLEMIFGAHSLYGVYCLHCCCTCHQVPVSCTLHRRRH